MFVWKRLVYKKRLGTAHLKTRELLTQIESLEILQSKLSKVMSAAIPSQTKPFDFVSQSKDKVWFNYSVRLVSENVFLCFESTFWSFLPLNFRPVPWPHLSPLLMSFFASASAKEHSDIKYRHTLASFGF